MSKSPPQDLPAKSYWVQSVMLRRDLFTRNQATAWIRDKGFKLSYYGKGVDVTPNWYRYRQKSPKNFKFYFIKKSKTPGVQFVVGY